MLWIRNAGDKYYSANAARGLDSIYGYAGMLRTYGVTVSFKK